MRSVLSVDGVNAKYFENANSPVGVFHGSLSRNAKPHLRKQKKRFVCFNAKYFENENLPVGVFHASLNMYANPLLEKPKQRFVIFY